jgi:hypothetical protein
MLVLESQLRRNKALTQQLINHKEVTFKAKDAEISRLKALLNTIREELAEKTCANRNMANNV